MFPFPVYCESFIHLYRLTRLNTLPTQDALAGVVTVKRIRQIHRIWLRLVGVFLVLNFQFDRRIVNPAES